MSDTYEFPKRKKDLKKASDKKLRKLERKAEEAIAKLHAELERRAEKSQHKEILRIDEHLEHVGHRFAALREFWQSLTSPKDSESSSDTK